MSECIGKRKYPGVKEAEKAVTRMWAKDASLKIGDLHWYHCPSCRHYHIGHRARYEEWQARESAKTGG